MDSWRLGAVELAAKVAAGEITCRAAVEGSLARIDALEPRVKALMRDCRESALARADELDARAKAGEGLGPLGGVPVVIKDNLCWEGHVTSCSSKILEGYRAPYTAHVLEKLLSADAVIVGQANMDEFAMGSSTENSAFHTTRNPWDTERGPGGSSGGSAAAVAAGMVPLSLGSDTGGSIRQPASFCGVIGFKPTYGAVSRWGLVAFGSSLDQIGPFARSVEDAALLFQVIAGHDERDSTSAHWEPGDVLSLVRAADVKGRKFGVPEEYFIEGMEKPVEEAVRAAIEKFRDLGAELVPISLPHTKYAVPIYYIVATAECSSNLARYDGVHYGHRASGGEDLVSLYSRTRREGFGAEVKRRVMLGTYALSAGYYDAYYLRALKVRTLVKRDFDRAFEKVDFILTPTSPTVPFKLGERVDDPLSMYLSDVFTINVNLAGLPGVSLPCGFVDGLPVGLQVIGRNFDDDGVLGAAAAFERVSGLAGCTAMDEGNS
ncbi:MAG: Asp-tRNA(Asn)/Glu-tRNA(Gln) amidotransferase subunit GatA [Planctomycetota bacterium]